MLSLFGRFKKSTLTPNVSTPSISIPDEVVQEKSIPQKPVKSLFPRAGSVEVQSEGEYLLKKQQERDAVEKKAYDKVLAEINSAIRPRWLFEEKYRYVHSLKGKEIKNWSPALTDKLEKELKSSGWACRIDVIYKKYESGSDYGYPASQYCMLIAISRPNVLEIHGMDGYFETVEDSDFRDCVICKKEKQE